MTVLKRRRYSTWIFISFWCLIVCYYIYGVKMRTTEDAGVPDSVMHVRQLRYTRYLASESNKTIYGRVELSPEEKKLGSELFDKEGLNIVMSDKIPLDRGLEDRRPQQ